MEHALQRLIQGGIVERRANATWIREAMIGGLRWDLAGTVSAVEGDIVTDEEQAWPVNLYGRSVTDGRIRPGCRLRMRDGAAAGQTWPIETTQGRQLRVQGGVDLAVAGVAAGDAYVIDRTEDDGAVTWFAKTHIRTILGYPVDHEILPCYGVIEANTGQGASPIGRHRDRDAPAAGPVTDTLVFEWRGAWTVVASAAQPEEALWLARALEHVYRQSVRLFDRISRDGAAQFQASGLQQVALPKAPMPTYAVECTVTLTRETFVQEEILWLNDQSVEAAATPRRVQIKASP